MSLLLAATVGCAGSDVTGRPESESVVASSVPQPPSITFTAREKAPRAFAARDAVECLRTEGLSVALPPEVLAALPPEARGADDARPASQPFDPTVSGAAWIRCVEEMTAYLEVAPASPEPVTTVLARQSCMADQGFIEAFLPREIDSTQHGQAQGFCSGDAPSPAGLLICDAFRIAAAGTMETDPVRADFEQLITVDGTAPPTSSVGSAFVVTIRPYELTMPPTLYGFTVVDGSSFVRAFTVDGGTIDPASVRSAPPAEPDVTVTAESDGTTATFRYDSVVVATESITFPEATFEVTPSAPGRVVTTFSGYEQSITFDVEGEQRVVRILCTSRFGTPVAWSDAT
jgi:hypothetical protein